MYNFEYGSRCNGPNGNLNVVAKAFGEFDQFLQRKNTDPPPQQFRNSRLPDPKQVAGLRLRKTALRDILVDIADEVGLGKALLWIRQPEVGENIAASFDDLYSLRHLSPP